MNAAILLSFCLFVWPKTTPFSVKLFAMSGKSSVSYEGSHALHSWTATSKEVVCIINYNPDKQEIETVAASAKVISFDSRNSNRDSNAFEKLEALAFPRISFTSASIITNPDKITINGNLTFHGVVKPMTIHARTSMKDDKMKVEGSFPVNLKDFGIVPPALLGTAIKEEIMVKFTFVFDTNQ